MIYSILNWLTIATMLMSVAADSRTGCNENPPQETVGLGLVTRSAGVISRWAQGTPATVFINRPTFTTAQLTQVDPAVSRAISGWNKANIGLTFATTTSNAYSAIEVYNAKNTGTCSSGNVYAFVSDFPNQNGFIKIGMCKFWFDTVNLPDTAANKDSKAHAFTSVTHEFGHFLGFNHEEQAGVSGSSGGAAGYSSLGGSDPLSVMSYQDNRLLTSQDVSDAKKYYSVPTNYYPGRTIKTYNLRKYTPPQVRHCCKKYLGICVKYCV